MGKIYNSIPGILIHNNSIMDKIFALLDSITFDKWIEVNEKVYSLEFFAQNDEFFVMYLDPRGVIKRLYFTRRADIIVFMKEHINYEYGDGVDIAICPKDLHNSVVCNHDGQIFILKPL